MLLGTWDSQCLLHRLQRSAANGPHAQASRVEDFRIKVSRMQGARFDFQSRSNLGATELARVVWVIIVSLGRSWECIVSRNRVLCWRRHVQRPTEPYLVIEACSRLDYRHGLVVGYLRLEYGSCSCILIPHGHLRQLASPFLFDAAMASLAPFCGGTCVLEHLQRI